MWSFLRAGKFIKMPARRSDKLLTQSIKFYANKKLAKKVENRGTFEGGKKVEWELNRKIKKSLSLSLTIE